MAYSLWQNKRHELPSAFDLFFRKNPFGGEFTVFAGLEEVVCYPSLFPPNFHNPLLPPKPRLTLVVSAQLTQTTYSIQLTSTFKIRFLSDFRFKEEHVEYVKTILPDAEEGFLEWLRGVDCSKVTVKAIKEGNVVFPRVPLLTVEVSPSHLN